MKKKRTRNNWQIGKFFIFRCAGFPFELIESLKFPKTIKVINDLSETDLKVKFKEGQKLFEEEFYEKRLAIQRIASLPKFKEAIFLQDIGAYKSIGKFSKTNIGERKRTSKIKSREFLIYKYLQRFCTKNESISFFGPHYIGDFSGSVSNIKLIRSAGGPIGKRLISFPYWFLFCIIDAIEADERILSFLEPAIPPDIYFDKSSAIILKTNASLKLDKLSIEILRLADGKAKVRDISSRLVRNGFKRDEISERIRWMFKHSFLLSGFEITGNVEDPEKYLLEKLENILGTKNNEWYIKLKKLSILKKKFEDADFPARLSIFDELSRLFSQLIKEGYSKSRFYGRNFFSEYCSLNLERLELGRKIHRDFSLFFNLILDLAAFGHERLEKIKYNFFIDWFNNMFGNGEAGIKDVIFAASQRKNDIGGVFKLADLDTDVHGLSGNLALDFVAFLDKNKSRKFVRLKINELKPKFNRYLEPSGMAAATCCDVFICAPDISAINKGKFNFIFGESHKMRQPASIYSGFCDVYARKNTLRKELAKVQRYLAGGRVLAQLLTNPRDMLDKNFDSRFPAEIEYDLYSKSRKRRINFCDLKIRHDGKSLKFLDRRNKEVLLLDSLPFFGSLFSVLSPALKCLRQAQVKSRFPRVDLDNFVFQREQWIFPKKDLFFAQDKYKKEGLELWLELEKWRRNQNMPKHIFLRADNRIKPIFIDFENYFAIEAFINFVKRAKKSISIEEMLPGPEGLWFKDKDGRYTCEFRLILYKKANHPGSANNCPPGKSCQNS